jgi:hypothetical protein
MPRANDVRCALGRTTRFAILAAGLPLIAVACGPSVPPTCYLPRPAPKAKAGLMAAASGVKIVRTPTWDQWLALLLKGYSATTGDTSSATDCSGEKLTWQEPEGCAEGSGISTDGPLPAKPLTEDDFVVNRLKGDRWLVWVLLQKYPDGDALGPVALAENKKDGVAITAIGVLRAVPQRARLRLETVNERTFVIAEGDRCSSPSPKSCRRIVRLLMRRGQRLVARPLVRQDGSCIGPALFNLGREETLGIPGGWRRRFELSTTLKYEADRIRVHEQVVVSDTDTNHPEVPPRIFRRAGDERCIQIDKEGRLVVPGTSLWSRILQDQASVHVPARGSSDTSVEQSQ